MNPNKIDVLMAGPQSPRLTELADAAFNLHKLWLAPDRQAFIAEHADAIRGVITNAPVGAGRALIDALPKLEIIASLGVGLDAIDLDTASRRNIIVTSTPAVLNACVADAGIALLLAVSRRICEADRFVRAGKWLDGKFPLATSLNGKTCGILGMGQIGQAVARRAAAFDLKVVYFDPFLKTNLPYRSSPDPESVARESDFLILTLPGGDQTNKLVNADMLRALGPNGYLINISRGTVVDQAALIDALKNGVIAGAGLDVFEQEPNVPAELLSLQNVVLTPHLASATNETRNAMSELTFANIEAHFAGEPVLTPVR